MQTSQGSLTTLHDEPIAPIMFGKMMTNFSWKVGCLAHIESGASKILDVGNPTLALLNTDLGSTGSVAVSSVNYVSHSRYEQ